MAINVMEDITDLKRAEHSQRLLAEAGEVIGASMDSERIVQRVCDLAVAPWLSDWCSVHLPDEEGGIVLAAHASSSPKSASHLLELDRRFPALPGAPRGVPHVLEAGATEIYADVTLDLMEAEARSPEHLALMQRAGPYSALLALLIARGRVLGVLSLLRLGEGRRYGAEDVAMVEELGRRVGIAVDNARLYAERSYIAKTLQASLLPAELPDIPGLETGARFRATGEGNDVGGDFYDLFEAGGGGWSVVVGDVCGKGPDAAAVTALARYTLRAAAMREPRPSAGLRILNEALLRQRSDLRFATVAYASLVPESGGARVELASAGHPLPLVLRSDGSVEVVGSTGTLVGVVPDPDLDDASAYLREGDALVFYTDGVTEARDEGGGILGERRLERLLSSCAGMDADGIAATVERAAVERQNGDTRDDIRRSPPFRGRTLSSCCQPGENGYKSGCLCGPARRRRTGGNHSHNPTWPVDGLIRQVGLSLANRWWPSRRGPRAQRALPPARGPRPAAARDRASPGHGARDQLGAPRGRRGRGARRARRARARAGGDRQPGLDLQARGP